MTTQIQSIPSKEKRVNGFFKRLPVVLQSEVAECGLACLNMIADYFGYSTSLAQLRHQYPISSQGANLKQLIEIAAKAGLTGRALKLDIEDLCHLQTPCILHWDLNHFVVLKHVSKKHIEIHDPAVGKRRLSMEQVANHFTGIALELQPADDFRPRDEKISLRFSQFWNRITGLKRSLIMLAGLSLLIQLFAVAAPYYMQTVIDDVLLRSDHNLLLVLAIGFGLLMLVETGTHLLRDFALLNLTSKMSFQMASNVFHHLIRLPMEYFSKRHMGDIVSRFGSLNQIRDLMTQGVISVFIDGLMAIITLSVMFWYNTHLALLVLLFVALYSAVRIIFYFPLRYLTEERIIADANEHSHFMESIRAIQTLKLFEKETEREAQWQNKFAEALNKHIRIRSWEFSFDSANRILFGLENILVIFFAAIAVTENLLTVGMLFAFISYKNRFTTAMDNLILKAIEFRMLDIHFERLADVVFHPKDALVERPANTISHISDELSGQLSVHNLGFAYTPGQEKLFKNINVTIKAGEIIAITGASGSGKTTLFKCLMGLLQPSSGSVIYDDKPIEEIAGFRNQIAAVMQDDQLLSGSILENIACFESQIDLERVHLVSKMASIFDDILKMPMQFNTTIGEMGISLSGGQKQRLLLARALYKKPNILFLDEATSHLDISNELTINDSLSSLAMTRILIAHRPETIRQANRVFQLASGELNDVTHLYKR